ncbi:MAG: hypothetical protein ACKN9U_24225, partial [Pirellulaceae bacterium]
MARSNFVPIEDESQHPLRRMIVRERFSTNGKGNALRPKIIHRGMADVQVGQGNHKLLLPEGVVPTPTDRIIILHYPLRTFDANSW